MSALARRALARNRPVTAVTRLLPWTSIGVGAAILYHRIDDPPGNPELEISPSLGLSSFQAQLDELGRRYELVYASELLDAIKRRRRGQRLPVAITFDDDLESHRKHAVPLVSALGAPATFFVAGVSPGAGRSYWWERLERIVAAGTPAADAVPRGVSEPLSAVADDPAATIHQAARAISQLEANERSVVEARLAELDPGDGSAGLDQTDLSDIASAGFEIGFHTKGHHILPQLDEADLERALVDGKGELEEVIERPVTLIAYPHGKADGRVASAARAAGYRVGFRASNRAIAADADPLLLDRIVPARWSKEELRASLARALVDAHLPPHTDTSSRRLR